MATLDAIRALFPITTRCFVAPDGTTRRIIYLDHGATTHPPRPVLDYYREFLENYYANIHRGKHYLSQKASDLFDEVTATVLRFVGATDRNREVIFTSNTTTAIDIAAHLMKSCPGGTIVTEMEHHSNDLPHRRAGEVWRAHVTPEGRLDYDEIAALLASHDVKLVAVTGASNVTGYLTDIHRIARLAHAHGAKILVDGAQLLAHRRVTLDGTGPDDRIDFFAAAGHKAYAPFGAAFLIAPADICESTAPYIPGGGTVRYVTNDNVLWGDGHHKHSGGTPNIPGVIALGRALEWLEEIGMEWVMEHERELSTYLYDKLSAMRGITTYGSITPDEKLGVYPFNVAGYRHDEASTILNNRFGIATRNGCFCAHPYVNRLLNVCTEECDMRMMENDPTFSLPGAVRATIGIFNTREDLDALCDALNEMVAHPEWAAEAITDDEMRCSDFA